MRYFKMIKRLPALKARQNLGQVMNEVAIKGDDYIIERAGKPLVAIISMEKYQMIQQERREALEALNEVWDKMRGEDPDVIESTIAEAVKAVKNKPRP
jgi:prevent-host-death family protein